MFNALSVAGFGGSIANAFSPDSKVLGESVAENERDCQEVR